MAKTIGYLQGAKGLGYTQAVTRVSDQHLQAILKTWHGSLTLVLKEDGSFYLEINDNRIVEGNVDRDEAFCGPAMRTNAAKGGGEYTPRLDMIDELEDAIESMREAVEGYKEHNG